MGMPPLPEPATSAPAVGPDGGVPAAARPMTDLASSTSRDLRVLRRVRTLARLRRAGLSEQALSAMLPELTSDVESLQTAIDPVVHVILPD